MSEAPLPQDQWVFPYLPEDTSYSVKTKILATVVIVIALLVSFVAFLHLYLRYVLYRRQLNGRRGPMVNLFGFSVNAAAAAADGEPPRPGLDASAIAALPTFRYQRTKKKEDESGPRAGDEGSYTECAVCLSAVEEGETVRLLPGCKHLFHIGCIDMWLGSNSTCPVCRAVVEPPSKLVSADVGKSSAPEELSGATGTTQEGTSESKEEGSGSSRISLSFRRMLSRERSTGRRNQANLTQDLERQ